MKKTDRQTDKPFGWHLDLKSRATYFEFTAYEPQYVMVDEMLKNPAVEEMAYQSEICPNTQRKHRQGWLKLHEQNRLSYVTKQFPGLHLECARNPGALKNYSKKKETRDLSGNSFSGKSVEQHLTMAQALIKLCSYADPKPVLLSIPCSRTGPDGKEIPLAPRLEWNYEYDAKAQYVSAVKNWLKINPNIIALVTQPQYKSAYSDFWQDFQAIAVEIALHGPESEGYSITPEPDEEIVEPPFEDFAEYSFCD